MGSVNYADYRNIEDALSYDFAEEKKYSFRGCDKKELLKHISGFVSNIWQTHPFMEGNTRTTALFTECYLNSLGFEVNNVMFAEKAKYFRNALVRANYADVKNIIFAESSFLEAFIENLVFDGKHKLQSRNLIMRELLPEHEME